MKTQFAADLAEGARVDSQFVLRSKELRLARSGEGYLALELGDRSGVVRAVLFRPSPLARGIAAGEVVTVRGVMTTFRGSLRVSVETISPAGAYRREDMVPDGERDRRELLRELRRLVRSVEDPGLRAVVSGLLGDRRRLAAFVAAPSSVDDDHAYVGGLLEHTVAVAGACLALAGVHEEADADLLLAAALVHDVGKVDSLRFDTSLQLTDAGRLVGHVALGHALLVEAIASADPAPCAPVACELVHAVLAHHEGPGGSGVEPVTLEALLLREADRTDRVCSRFLRSTRPAMQAEERWTAAAGGRPSLYVPARREREALAAGA